MSDWDKQQQDEIRSLVFAFFAEECDIDSSKLTDATNIIEELEGDSLMLLSLLEIVRKKYCLKIELKTLGKHLMKKPANTIGQVVELTLKIVRHGDNIVNVDV
jgi:acyl carrier protein